MCSPQIEDSLGLLLRINDSTLKTSSKNIKGRIRLDLTQREFDQVRLRSRGAAVFQYHRPEPGHPDFRLELEVQMESVE